MCQIDDKTLEYWKHRALSAELSAKLNHPSLTEKDKQIAALQQRLIEIENSRSWKITSPLRRLIEKYHNLRRIRMPHAPAKHAEASVETSRARENALTQFSSPEALEKWSTLLSATQSNEAAS